jgi:hypothetical protein
MRAIGIAALVFLFVPSGSYPPSFCGSQPYVFFTVSVPSASGYKVAFVDDGTVRYTEGEDTRSARLSAEDNSKLSALVSRSNLTVELVTYQLSSGQEASGNEGNLILSSGPDTWDVPAQAVGSLSRQVLDLVEFADVVARKYFRNTPPAHRKG